MNGLSSSGPDVAAGISKLVTYGMYVGAGGVDDALGVFGAGGAATFELDSVEDALTGLPLAGGAALVGPPLDTPGGFAPPLELDASPVNIFLPLPDAPLPS